MRRLFHVIGLFILILLIAAGCSNTSTSSGTNPAEGQQSAQPASEGSSTEKKPDKVVLKVGHVFAADHPWNVALEGMAKDVLESTDGAVEIQVFPSSQMGGDRDVAEGLQLGTVEMGVFGTGALQSLDKRMIVEELPYAWPSREKAYEAIDGELGEALASVMKEKGIVALSWWESGYRHITNSVRPITTPEELKGMKLRVPEAEMRIDTFKELGALPTPMAFSEVFTGLQQKVVDGQENPLATIYASKFYEVQKHLALSGHIWGSAMVAVSEKKWNEIPENYQKIILEKAKIWKEKEREMIRKGDEEILAKLKEAGMQVTEPDKKAFQEMVQPVWTKYESELGKDLVDIVRKYSK